MNDPKKKVIKLHFIGIGGIGMSGIAQVFHNQGYVVSGSDQNQSETTLKLENLGIQIYKNHSEKNVVGVDVVVISSAIKKTNVEVVEAKKLRIPVIPRAEMLGELMRGKIGIAVGGTHGKTTTTSLLSTILSHAQLDPTIVIGGKVNALGGNAKLGQGRFVIAEADESDGSFLHLPATFSVITNIDSDHLDFYQNLTRIDQAFIEFVAKIPFYGKAVVCADDPGVRRCLPEFIKPVLTYGVNPDLDYSAQNIQYNERTTIFEVYHLKKSLGKITLKVPGRHNVLNALAAAIVALELGVSFKEIQEGVQSFTGVQRRFDKIWENSKKSQVLMDDYAHHPTEIRATLQAARHYWKGRILAVFQPHRYSRTVQCRDGFLSCFQDSDITFITDIYSAGEEPIEGVDAKSFVADLQQNTPGQHSFTYSGSLEETLGKILHEMKEGDLVLCMGAGSIPKLSQNLKTALEKMK